MVLAHPVQAGRQVPRREEHGYPVPHRGRARSAPAGHHGPTGPHVVHVRRDDRATPRRAARAALAGRRLARSADPRSPQLRARRMGHPKDEARQPQRPACRSARWGTRAPLPDERVPGRRRPRVLPSAARHGDGPQRAREAVQEGVEGGVGPGGSVPRSASHVWDEDGCGWGAAPDVAGVDGAPGLRDDVDLRGLPAVSARGGVHPARIRRGDRRRAGRPTAGRGIGIGLAHGEAHVRQLRDQRRGRPSPGRRRVRHPRPLARREPSGREVQFVRARPRRAAAVRLHDLVAEDARHPRGDMAEDAAAVA